LLGPSRGVCRRRPVGSGTGKSPSDAGVGATPPIEGAGVASPRYKRSVPGSTAALAIEVATTSPAKPFLQRPPVNCAESPQREAARQAGPSRRRTKAAFRANNVRISCDVFAIYGGCSTRCYEVTFSALDALSFPVPLDLLANTTNFYCSECNGAYKNEDCT